MHFKFFTSIYQTVQLELHRESITYVRRSLTSFRGYG